MMLLGLARGGGGIALLLRGGELDPKIQATNAAAYAVGLGLVLLGGVLIASGLGLLRGVRVFWTVGVAAVLVFVVDGAINGYVLYGHPGDRGTVVNMITAALIVTCLVLGKEGLPSR